MNTTECPPTECNAAAEAEMQQLQDSEVIRLAEENRRLAAENRRLHGEQREREVSRFMEGLRQAGRLTPALEQSGVEQALLAAELQQITVPFPDGSSTELAAVLRELLTALPVSYGYGELAMDELDSESQAALLTADELSIAAQLGLSPEEYSAIKHSPG